MYDAIIIGGGILGCLSALRLIDHGLSCLIIDKSDMTKSASMRSAGGIYLQINSQVAELDNKRLGDASNLVALLDQTLPAWLRLRDRLPDLPMESRGGMVVALNEIEWQCLLAKNAFEASHNLPTVLLDGNQARHLSPDLNTSVVGASFSVNEGHCHPAGLMKLVFVELASAGVQIVRNESVIDADFTCDHSVRVTLRNGQNHVGRHIILATGADTGSFLETIGLSHGVKRLGIQMASFSDSALQVPSLTRRVGKKLSVKRIDSQNIWVGGGWPAQPDSKDPHTLLISMENLKRNLQEALAVFPTLANARYNSAWAAHAAWTTDGLPAIGRSGRYPRLLMACGGNGFSLGPLYAELLTDSLMENALSIDLTPFSPDRFVGSASSNGEPSSPLEPPGLKPD